jgi:hypothetical protein
MDILIVFVQQLFERTWKRLHSLRDFHAAFGVAFIGVVMFGFFVQKVHIDNTKLPTFTEVMIMIGAIVSAVIAVVATLVGTDFLNQWRKLRGL